MKISTQVLAALTALFSIVSTDLGALADSPTVTQLVPVGFERGKEVELLIQGARLGDTAELLLYDSGVEVVELLPEGDNKVRAKLRIADDCQPGLHSFRLATRSGISNIRYFGVSPLPQAEEAEPNDDFAAPQTVAMNTTINGLCKTEDVDYYAVDLAEGQSITVELEGLRLGTDFFDPFVAILDENRFEVARSDDAPLLQQDCLCSYKAPKAGKYIIEVRESSFGGNDRAFYRLHVGDFPRPTAIVPSGGRPGEKIEATVVDVSGATWKETIQLPDTPGEFDYTVVHDGKSAPSPNKLRVVDLPNYGETQGDDENRDALVAVELPAAFNGILEKEGDVDWFKVIGKKDQQLDFVVYGRRTLRSPIDSWLEIYKAGGGRLAVNDDSGGPDSIQNFKFPEDGEYLIGIRDQLNEGSDSHAYRIEVAPGTPSLSFTIDELERYVAQTIEVPQGAQMAVLLRAKRQNFGGELNLRLEGAPAGIELVTPTVAANQSYIPMMIRASKEAQPDAALVSLIGQTPAEGTQVTGGLEQRTMLVRGQNNVDVWGHDSKRLALAVTEELPFTISVEQPKVPLVRNGNSEYVVRCTRKEGYNERIYLRVLYNPGGCSASGSVRIEPDQTEARIPVTANSKPQTGVFPITVLARAKATNANVWVASEFINLEVADSFFDFKFPKSVATQGESGQVTVGVEVKRPPEGTVEFELVGLPAGVSSPTPKVALTEGMEQLNFPIQIAADARIGQFKSLVVRAVITRPEGTITQTEGTGELQIVAPVVAPTAVAAAPAAAAPAAPAAKPLSRLEQLRQAKGLLEGTQQ